MIDAEYHREYYERTKERRRELKRAVNRARRELFRINLAEYLLEHPCVDCGEADPVVLEFDHLRDKKHDISQMDTYMWDTVLEEIVKCEVCCANCHRRRTAKQFGWRK